MPGRVGRIAATLGSGLTDYAIQFAIPIVLVRTLDVAQYGTYQLIWLTVLSAASVSLWYLPESLFYFLGGRTREQQGLYVRNSTALLAMAGVLVGVVLWAAFDLLPEGLRGTDGLRVLLPAFTALWISGALLDTLPSAEGRFGTQFALTVTLSVFRAAVVIGAAVVTGDVAAVAVGLLLVGLLRVSILGAYIGLRFGWRGGVDGGLFRREQVPYCLPFGVAGALYMLRGQADRWVAAAAFSAAQFAVYSVGIYVAPFANLVRQAVGNVFLVEMSEARAAGEIRRLWQAYQAMVGWLAGVLFPVLAFMWVFAEHLVSLVFTNVYVEGTSVLRVYAIGHMTQALAANAVLRQFGEGPFVVRVNAVLILLAVALSAGGAILLGMWGAAVGSSAALWIGEILLLRRSVGLAGGSIADVLLKAEVWLALGGSIVAALAAYAISEQVRGGIEDLIVPLVTGLAAMTFIYGTIWLVGSVAVQRWRLPSHRNGAS